MPWATEFLHNLGDVDGVNKTFTLSHTPVAASLRVGFPFVLLEPVGSQPMEMQFMRSGAVITLGLAPLAGTRPWALYFYNEGS